MLDYLQRVVRVTGEFNGTRITSVPATNSELRIEFSLVDDDEPEAVYEIQVLSGSPGGEGAQESKAIEVQAIRRPDASRMCSMEAGPSMSCSASPIP